MHSRVIHDEQQGGSCIVCLMDRNYLQASSTNRLDRCWRGEIRWQPAVWKVPPLPAQTMSLIHSPLTVRLFDITFQLPTHSLFSVFPLTYSTFCQREGLKQNRLHHVNSFMYHIFTMFFFFFFPSCPV